MGRFVIDLPPDSPQDNQLHYFQLAIFTIVIAMGEWFGTIIGMQLFI